MKGLGTVRCDIGYGGAFPSMTVRSESAVIPGPVPAPTNLSATLQAGPQVTLSWTDNASNETGFVVERSLDGGANFTQVGTAPARNGTGNVTWVDTGVTLGLTYTYRVAATGANGATSAWSNRATILVAVPAPPENLQGTAARFGNNERVTLTWTDVATNETGYTIQRSTSVGFTSGVTTVTRPADTQTYTTGNISRTTWYFRVQATNALGPSAWVTVEVAPAP